MKGIFTLTKSLSTLMLLLFLSTNIWAQTQSHLDIALRYLEENKTQWNLTDADIADMVITDNYVSKNSGATMIYFLQRHQGIKVYNAMYNVAVSKNGKVVHTGNKLIPNIVSKINTAQPSLTPQEAIESALVDLEIEVNAALVQKERKNDQEFVFKKGAYSNSDIPANLRFFKDTENTVRLIWEVSIDMVSKNDYWNMKVDAVTGKILKKNNLVIKCNFGNTTSHNHDTTCENENINTSFFQKEISVSEALAAPVLLGGSYNVYAEKDANGNVHPHESPIHGDRNLLTGIENLEASPFGWHDTNGQAGEEFTITRGNNVHGYLDLGGNDSSSNDEPEGGAELIFDFPLDINNEPTTFQEASVTNAFFMVNFIHDFAFANGFDSEAGSFQDNNYGNGGQGGDHVVLEVDDGSGTNNANFLTPSDGGNGRMQMFLWTSGPTGLLTVEAPVDIAGIYDVSHPTDWGGAITTVPLTAEAAIVDDGSLSPSMGCGDLLNGTELEGKIAIIDRGLCEFGLKVLNAENAGAVGAIICNFEDALANMGGGAVGAETTIPVIGMTLSDCITLKSFVGSGLNISFVIPTSSGPDELSGGLDNGIIAHEYGHGISNRLIGGPSNNGCLSGGEQMGEGISDFFTLVTTVKEGDTGEMKKGIGTFVRREETDGGGIRRYPYSTDMTINPLTYKDIVGQTAPHPIGEIWTLCLWEMYWALVEEEGFDPDLMNGTGGNNVAVKLAIEAMKITSCNPGYVQARDAIFGADALMYESAHECLIWKAFAKRGVGEFADQGLASDSNDGTEDFTVPIMCLDEIQIKKTVSDVVIAGEVIDVTIDVNNYRPITSTDVIVTDEIPAGATLVAGSAGAGATVSGNIITFDLGDLAPLEVKEITYQLDTDPTITSTSIFFDDMENGDGNWDIEFEQGSHIWDIRDDTLAHSGTHAWFVQDVAMEEKQNLFKVETMEVTGTQPVLVFYHWFDTEPSADGGLLQVSTDQLHWDEVADKMFRKGYPRSLQYGTFVVPFLSAFSGQSSTGEEFIATYVDMSDYLGEDIYIRFRFGSDDNTAGIAWIVDDVELMDMKNYQGVACVTTGQGSNECTDVITRGTAVATAGTMIATQNPFDTNMGVKLFPNPTDEILNIHVRNDKSTDGLVRILTVDGKEVISRSFRTVDGVERLSFNVSQLAAGMYFVKVSTDEGIVVEKLTIK